MPPKPRRLLSTIDTRAPLSPLICKSLPGVFALAACIAVLLPAQATSPKEQMDAYAEQSGQAPQAARGQGFSLPNMGMNGPVRPATPTNPR